MIINVKITGNHDEKARAICCKRILKNVQNVQMMKNSTQISRYSLLPLFGLKRHFFQNYVGCSTVTSLADMSWRLWG
jgi:hypothetical protein